MQRGEEQTDIDLGGWSPCSLSRRCFVQRPAACPSFMIVAVLILAGPVVAAAPLVGGATARHAVRLRSLTAAKDSLGGRHSGTPDKQYGRDGGEQRQQTGKTDGGQGQQDGHSSTDRP